VCTRACLLEAAAHVVGEKGWERTSLADVAARAGKSRSNPCATADRSGARITAELLILGAINDPANFLSV